MCPGGWRRRTTASARTPPPAQAFSRVDIWFGHDYTVTLTSGCSRGSASNTVQRRIVIHFHPLGRCIRRIISTLHSGISIQVLLIPMKRNAELGRARRKSNARKITTTGAREGRNQQYGDADRHGAKARDATRNHNANRQRGEKADAAAAKQERTPDASAARPMAGAAAADSLGLSLKPSKGFRTRQSARDAALPKCN